MPAKFQALRLSKKDAPKDAIAAAALTTTVKAIATAMPTMKTKTACVEFFEALGGYAARNVAELAGTKARPAAAATAKSAKPKATAKAGEKAMGASA